MMELKIILEESILSIDQTTELLYQQKLEQGYNKFEDTLTLLTQAMNALFTVELKNDGFDIERNKIIHVLTDAMNAMEAKDPVLLSDILQYELKEVFIKIIYFL